MEIEVKYFGHLRRKVGRKKEVKEIQDSSTLGSFLAGLSKIRGISEDVFGDPLQGVEPKIMILINGRNIKFLQQMDTVLKDGDVIGLFPPIGGG